MILVGVYLNGSTSIDLYRNTVAIFIYNIELLPTKLHLQLEKSAIFKMTLFSNSISRYHINILEMGNVE